MATNPEGRRFVRMEELKRKTGKSRSGIYDAIRAGAFPPPVRIGLRASAWLSDEVDDWIAARVAEAREVTK
jgi:prophage regulatory protein